MIATLSSADAVAELWRLAGGDAAAIDYLHFSGDDPVLPSSFRIGTAAQASIAVVGLAAAELHYRAGASRQTVGVDMRHAAVEFRSEQYLTIDGGAPASIGDPLFGAYRTGDGRFVRLHMNFPHHRDNVLKFLGCAPMRAAIEAALKNWEAIAFETEAYRRRLRGGRDALAGRMGKPSAGGCNRVRSGSADRKNRRCAAAAAS